MSRRRGSRDALLLALGAILGALVVRLVSTLGIGREPERMCRPASNFDHAHQLSSKSGAGQLHRGSCYCSDASFGDFCMCTPAVAVDVVIERRDGAAGDGALQSLLMMHRYDGPGLAIVGGYVEIDEAVEDAAIREVREETGVSIDRSHLRQLHVFSDPKRDPRRHTVSTVFVASVPAQDSVIAHETAPAAAGVQLKVRARARLRPPALLLARDVSRLARFAPASSFRAPSSRSRLRAHSQAGRDPSDGRCEGARRCPPARAARPSREAPQRLCI